MRPERARGERHRAVRGAAREWRRAQEISEATLEEIERAYPDDSVRLAPIWSVSVFLGVFLAGLAATIGVALALKVGDSAIAPLCLAAGIALAAATEIQQSRFRFVSTGSDAATSLLALLFLLFAWARWLESGLPVSGRGPQTLIWLAAFVLCGLFSWRWGFALYGLASASSLIFLAGRVFPAARIGWIAASCLVLLGTVPFLDRRSLPPSHRDALAAALAAALTALYAVFNPWSLEVRWIEEVSGRSSAFSQPAGGGRWLAAAATALFTILVLAWGIRKRRRLVLDLGAAYVVLSLVTLRHYVHLAPLWVILTVAGAAAVAVASGLERWLRRPPEGGFGGFTSRPLFGNERFLSNLSVAAATATLSLGPDTELAPSSKNFEGGGGGFGGGGASDGF